MCELRVSLNMLPSAAFCFHGLRNALLQFYYRRSSIRLPQRAAATAAFAAALAAAAAAFAAALAAAAAAAVAVAVAVQEQEPEQEQEFSSP